MTTTTDHRQTTDRQQMGTPVEASKKRKKRGKKEQNIKQKNPLILEIKCFAIILNNKLLINSYFPLTLKHRVPHPPKKINKIGAKCPF